LAIDDKGIMSKIAIVTDSTADLSKELYEKYKITAVPLSVIFENEVYIDNGIDITIEEFYIKLKNSKKLPTTTQPSPADFIKTYKKLFEEYESIISIHISKKMSGTLDSAEIAKKELPGKDIEIIDSELTTVGLGLIIKKAGELAIGGATKEDILNNIYDLKSKIHTMFIPYTLEYLKKGGRIGRAKSLIASMLEIKPILTLHLGEVSQYKTTRRWNQAKSEMINSMKDAIKSDKGLIAAVADADLKEDGDEMAEKIKELFSPKELIRAKIGCIVGTHLGPAVAVTFYQE
jgi:DegV family protein with EDD domain